MEALLETALDAPLESPRLESLARAGGRVVVIVSDATRDDPRRAMLSAVRARLPTGVRLTVAIANGTHAPGPVDALGLDPRDLEGATVLNPDARDATAYVDVGRTARGTPVRVHRDLAAADLIVATGRIKPHYFAGFGAGCKAIFPGLGEDRAVRINHALKQEAGARAGNLHGNPCRDDLAEAAAMVGGARFLLNAVCDADGHGRAAVAGDVEAAFAAGAALCRPWFTVRAPRSRLVVVSDALPYTASLYQACKLAAAAAPLLLPGGTLVVVAECPDGIGPVETVNRAIYDIGIRPRLPAEHRIVLVSSLGPDDVSQTFCTWAPSVESVLEACEAKPVIIPHAGAAIVEVAA